MIAARLAAAALTTAAVAGPAFLGPDDLSRSPCIAAAQALRVAIGPFVLVVPFSDLRRTKALERPEGERGCLTPLPVEDLLVSTPDGYRSALTYSAARVTPGDIERVHATLEEFARKPGCEARTDVRVCRIRANPLAPVTTFVFAADAGPALPSGSPAYQRCLETASGQVCKIQDLDPSGYQYEAAVEYSENAATIRTRHGLARAKWARFLRAGAPSPAPR